MTYTYTVARASTPVKSLRRKYLLYLLERDGRSSDLTCFWKEKQQRTMKSQMKKPLKMKTI